jgi:GAF domain-containing protein
LHSLLQSGETPVVLSETPPHIDEALSVCREVLDMDVAYLSSIDGEDQEILHVAGDGDEIEIRPGRTIPLADTYCARMLGGQIDSLVADAGEEPELADVAGPAAYVGVPLELHDGSIFGTLCAASGQPRPDLAERDVRFVRVLARVLAAELDRERLRDAFAELDRRERDRAYAIQLYRDVLQELVLARYAMDRHDERGISKHLERASEHTRKAVERLLPDEIEPGGLRGSEGSSR